MHHAIEWFIFHFMKVSGALWVLGTIFGGLATGQAEISYKFFTYSIVISLAVLIVARIEGHRAERQMSNIKNLSGYDLGDWERILGRLDGKTLREFFDTIWSRISATK